MGDFQSWVNQLNYDQLIEMVITVLAAVICITLHEVSHGYAAYRLGDPTAKNAGRQPQLAALSTSTLWICPPMKSGPCRFRLFASSPESRKQSTFMVRQSDTIPEM